MATHWTRRDGRPQLTRTQVATIDQVKRWRRETTCSGYDRRVDSGHLPKRCISTCRPVARDVLGHPRAGARALVPRDPHQRRNRTQPAPALTLRTLCLRVSVSPSRRWRRTRRQRRAARDRVDVNRCTMHGWQRMQLLPPHTVLDRRVSGACSRPRARTHHPPTTPARCGGPRAIPHLPFPSGTTDQPPPPPPRRRGGSTAAAVCRPPTVPSATDARSKAWARQCRTTSTISTSRPSGGVRGEVGARASRSSTVSWSRTRRQN
mmetsp:Transcript_30096/g.64975  ORF Transcript_30096/g.64975 Transcript_30096/m.64975 type:complete len:263 (+) Transcript_30096:593-1381(+)